MKKLLFILLLCPFLSNAQRSLPRLEKDTLYTTSGYNIYKGQILHFTTGTADAGYFKFIKFHYSTYKTNTYSLQNGSLLVKKLKNYKNSGTGENSIEILGTVTYADGKKEETDIIMNFERATEDFAGLPAELAIPAQYKTRRTETVAPEVKKQNAVDDLKKQNTNDDLKKIMIADEIKKLFDLYKQGALTKEEYETQKKKLLDRQ
jgi:hypothetical protein